jgi:hypothetical protein
MSHFVLGFASATESSAPAIFGDFGAHRLYLAMRRSRIKNTRAEFSVRELTRRAFRALTPGWARAFQQQINE